MGFTSGIVMGAIFGIVVMFGWSYMMSYRRTKRITKVNLMNCSDCSRLMNNPCVYPLHFASLSRGRENVLSFCVAFWTKSQMYLKYCKSQKSICAFSFDITIS